MKSLFNNIYQHRKVLVTGHTGFKGSWLTLWLNILGAEVYGISDSYITKPSFLKTIKKNIILYI